MTEPGDLGKSNLSFPNKCLIYDLVTKPGGFYWSALLQVLSSMGKKTEWQTDFQHKENKQTKK